MLIRKQNLFLIVSFVLALLIIEISYARPNGGPPQSGRSGSPRDSGHSSRQSAPSGSPHNSSYDRNRTGNSDSRSDTGQPYAPTTLPNGGRVNRNDIPEYGNRHTNRDNYSRDSHISYNHRYSEYANDCYGNRYDHDRYGKYNHRYYRRYDNVRRYVEVVSSSGIQCYSSPSVPRRYVFVSLNGYWPGYNNYRYYNYRTYPYYWSITGDSSYQFSGNSNESFADVATPVPQDSADRCFENGVNSFTAGDYRRAADYFFLAKAYAPTDDILPFSYVQALFAGGNYLTAAQNLRVSIERQPAERQWAFYPRGLYEDDNILTMQINTLISQASSNSDLQLLAGYQLLGVHRFDEALDYLNRAKFADSNNRVVVDKLIYILNNLKANSIKSSR
jgi:hypothetical protein